MIFNRYSIYAATCIFLCNYVQLTHNQPEQSLEGFKQQAQQQDTSNSPTITSHTQEPTRCITKKCRSERGIRRRRRIKKILKIIGISLGVYLLLWIPIGTLLCLMGFSTALAYTARGVVSCTYMAYVYGNQDNKALMRQAKRMAIAGGTIKVIMSGFFIAWQILDALVL